ncbi:MAG: hypothetical protein JJT75_05650 [Opitutales bacterium]|nr:hypothetical protein [Opitutales bacterium]MCH8540044.1 hypothetical protein [Opitutales bacterium]
MSLPVWTDKLADHPLFTPWEDPHTGVRSFVLRPVTGERQKAWYFTRPSVDADNAFLWFSIFRPHQVSVYPAAVPLQGDLEKVRLFPHWGQRGVFDPEDPRVVYFPVEDRILRQPVDGPAEEVFRLPKEILGSRHLFRLVTNPTLTADGKYFILDSRIGARWLISLVERETGAFHPLKWFGHEHHHAIASWHDPELFLINQGHWTDPMSGQKEQMDMRIWLMKTTLDRYEPLDSRLWFGRTATACHEWWTGSGKVQYCDYNEGVFEHDPETGKRELLWSGEAIHGMCDPTNHYLVRDQGCYKWNEKTPCRVGFLNRKTGRAVNIVEAMPPQPIPWRDFRSCHIDPHPHFSTDGSLVIYTTTALGEPSVAVCPLDELLRHTE